MGLVHKRQGPRENSPVFQSVFHLPQTQWFTRKEESKRLTSEALWSSEEDGGFSFLKFQVTRIFVVWWSWSLFLIFPWNLSVVLSNTFRWLLVSKANSRKQEINYHWYFTVFIKLWFSKWWKTKNIFEPKGIWGEPFLAIAHASLDIWGKPLVPWPRTTTTLWVVKLVWRRLSRRLSTWCWASCIWILQLCIQIFPLSWKSCWIQVQKLLKIEIVACGLAAQLSTKSATILLKSSQTLANLRPAHKWAEPMRWTRYFNKKKWFGFAQQPNFIDQSSWLIFKVNLFCSTIPEMAISTKSCMSSDRVEQEAWVDYWDQLSKRPLIKVQLLSRGSTSSHAHVTQADVWALVVVPFLLLWKYILKQGTQYEHV